MREDDGIAVQLPQATVNHEAQIRNISDLHFCFASNLEKICAITRGDCYLLPLTVHTGSLCKGCDASSSHMLLYITTLLRLCDETNRIAGFTGGLSLVLALLHVLCV